MEAGYSKTPLAKKLGIKEGFNLLFYNKPDHYFGLFSELPQNIEELEQVGKENADFIHVFCTETDELEKTCRKYIPALKKNGLMWVSWPKGSSSIETDLKRDPIRDLLLSLGLVDVKVCAVDEDWSGLKFVYRTKDR